jgi:putative transcriptional regulator
MKEIVVGNKLKLARVENDLTQQQLADLVGVTRQTIGLIESGDYNPTIKLCLLLSSVTGKSLVELFWIEGETNEEILPNS